MSGSSSRISATIDFFSELGLELEGRATIDGEWAGRVTGLTDQRVEIAMMRTPDGHSRLELSRFLSPPVVADHRNAPVNALGYLRVMFAVDDLDDTLERLRKRGAQLVGEVVQYRDVSSRLCFIRGPEGLLIGLLRNTARVSREYHQRLLVIWRNSCAYWLPCGNNRPSSGIGGLQKMVGRDPP